MEGTNFKLKFISHQDFENHVANTLKEYRQVLNSIDLKKFNSNVIDPIKLLFDKSVFKQSYEEIIKLEINRQRDRTNTNAIGYFHQNMFQYIKNCVVPKEGWDVVFDSGDVKYYVEMKNKHNTMNNSAALTTYMKMQNHLLNADDNNKSICALVEVIAKTSHDVPWSITVNKEKQLKNERLRRISIDKFYEIVTGDRTAFKQVCNQLPITINKLIHDNKTLVVQEDSVYEELRQIDEDILIALYQLAFSNYCGF